MEDCGVKGWLWPAFLFCATRQCMGDATLLKIIDRGGSYNVRLLGRVTDGSQGCSC
jgi:hypothetical protein